MRSKAMKGEKKHIGPKMFICPYCDEKVGRPKSKAWSGGRICKLHFCDLCGKPVRREGAEVKVNAAGDLITICRFHKCRVCDVRVLTERARVIDRHIICERHYCAICEKLTTEKTGIVINGRTICRSHPSPGKRKQEKIQ